MRMPPLLADFSHARACKPFCEKYLTLPALFPRHLFVRQIAFPFFYFGLDRKIIITSYNRAGNISIFNV